MQVIQLVKKQSNVNLTANEKALALHQKMMKGDDGGYYVPAVDDEGTLTWTPSEEDMPAVDASNITGPIGPQGSSGVYVGNDEPTNPSILVWLIPAGETSDYVMTEAEVKNYIDESLGEVEDGSY